MKQRKMIVSAFLILGFGLFKLQAQEALSTSGGNASGSDGSVSYTIGQVAYTANTTASGSVAQGVQQPYDISIVLGGDEIPAIDLILSVYPNPATNFIQLKVEHKQLTGLSYQLVNMQGKLMEEKQITEFITEINMHNLLTAAYFLKIKQDKKTVKTFKIVKN